MMCYFKVFLQSFHVSCVCPTFASLCSYVSLHCQFVTGVVCVCHGMLFCYIDMVICPVEDNETTENTLVQFGHFFEQIKYIKYGNYSND